MSVTKIRRKVAGTLVLGVFAFTFSGCTNLLYQIDEANQRVEAIKQVFARVDSEVRDSIDVAEKVSSDSLTAKVMKSNESDIEEQSDKLAMAKEELENTQVLFAEMEQLRLSDDYRQSYLADVKAAKDKRLEAIDNADNMLFKAENLAEAVVNFDSGVSRLEQVGDKFLQIPEIDFNKPETIQLAQQILEDVSSEAKVAQTELNNAAASVNVEAFTSLRDAAKDLEDVADASDGLVKIFEALLVSAEAGDLATFEQSYNNLTVQLEVLVAALEKFEANFPEDVIDDNGDLTTKAENTIESWKDENFKSLMNTADDLKDEIDALDSKIASYNN